MNGMFSRIDAPVRVAVIFGPGARVQPVWFEWDRRKYSINTVTYRYEGRDGNSRLLHFTVMVDDGLYELTYNTSDQLWLLRQVEVP